MAVIVAIALEAAAFVWTLVVAYAFTGPCTAEYTPELELDSPRWDFCHNAFGGLAAWGGLAVVPVAALFALRRFPDQRRWILILLAVGFGLALVWPVIGLQIANAISPTN
jgi:hypothetical protein